LLRELALDHDFLDFEAGVGDVLALQQQLLATFQLHLGLL